MGYGKLLFCSLLSAPLAAGGATVQERDRSKIADQYKWNLADIYPSDAAWRQAFDRLKAQILQIKQFHGTLGQGPEPLLRALDFITELQKEFSRSYSYASMKSDEDTRIA